MRYNRFKVVLYLFVIPGMLLVTSCTKEWDEHYNESSFDLPEETVAEYIKGNADLSTFYTMMEQSGYDAVLNASQSYTVWAPTNDALNSIDINNNELVAKIVKNHISRSRISTSGIIDSDIRMLNGKYVSFAQNQSGYTFGENTLTEANQPALNGLVHKINGFTPYTNNLWEYLGETEGLDSVRNYLYGQTIKAFDAANSVEIGTNDEGQILYDSVFVVVNPVLNELGRIDLEDSTYTAILPNNTAWDEAFARIEPYFNFPDNAGGAQRQKEMTKYVMIRDMFFRGKIEDPEALDSLASTFGNVFKNPGDLFNGLNYESLSNGLAYTTSQMPFADTASFFKEIRVEAEYPMFGRTNTGGEVYIRSSFGTEFTASGNYYLLVDPTSTAPSVEFTIPNTLSAKYNIYCVFVPEKIVDANNLKPTKVKFQLTYIRRSNGGIFIKRITPENNTTDPEGLTKMFVDQYDFEFANVYSTDYDEMVVKLEVTNAVSTEELQSGEFTQNMRIDCIILEPVTE